MSDQQPKPDGQLLHMQRPNAERDPVEIEVQHFKQVVEHHTLEGVCSSCGNEIKTNHPQAVMDYENGKDINGSCTCGQRFVAKGRSKIIKPKDIGRVVVPGKANNRAARRMKS